VSKNKNKKENNINLINNIEIQIPSKFNVDNINLSNKEKPKLITPFGLFPFFTPCPYVTPPPLRGGGVKKG
jgi:hypothetical protein